MSEVEGIPEWLDDAMISGRRHIGVRIEFRQIEVLRTWITRRVVAFSFVGLTGDGVEKPGGVESGGIRYGSTPKCSTCLLRYLNVRSLALRTRVGPSLSVQLAGFNAVPTSIHRRL